MKSPLARVSFALVLALCIGACSQMENTEQGNPVDASLEKAPPPPPPPPANPAITYVNTKQYKYKGVTYTVPSVYVMDADGTHQTMLWNNFTTNGSNGTYGTILYPKWSGNGQNICFSMPQDGDIYTLAVSLVNGVPTASNVTKILDGTTSGVTYHRPAWSPTANEIVVLANETGTPQRLQVVASTGGTPTTLYTCATTEYGIDSPCFSPDGSKIGLLLKKEVTSERWIIVIERSTGNVLNSISLDPNYYVDWMDWSRTSGSSTMAFSRHPVGGGQSNLFTLDISTSTTPTQVGSDGVCPTWSPDDGKLAYHHPQGWSIKALTLSSGVITTLSSTGNFPNWKR